MLVKGCKFSDILDVDFDVIILFSFFVIFFFLETTSPLLFNCSIEKCTFVGANTRETGLQLDQAVS